MDIGGIENVETGSRLLTAEDVAEVTAHIERLESENAALREHVKMPDEPLEIDEKDLFIRAFIKWCVEVKPEVERLEAENAKLREENQSIGMAAYKLGSKSLVEENEKLREHIADLWEFGFSKNAGANSIEEWHRRHDELRDRTSELLGIEVR